MYKCYSTTHQPLGDVDRCIAVGLWCRNLMSPCRTPVCIFTQQLGGEIRSGLSIPLWGNSAVLIPTLPLLTSFLEEDSSTAACIESSLSPPSHETLFYYVCLYLYFSGGNFSLVSPGVAKRRIFCFILSDQKPKRLRISRVLNFT